MCQTMAILSLDVKKRHLKREFLLRGNKYMIDTREIMSKTILVTGGALALSGHICVQGSLKIITRSYVLMISALEREPI